MRKNWYTKVVARTAPIPVRLSPDIIARIDDVADQMGNTRAGVIKLCITSFLAHFEESGGLASLPLDWKDVLDSLDGRTIGGRRQLEGAKEPVTRQRNPSELRERDDSKLKDKDEDSDAFPSSSHQKAMEEHHRKIEELKREREKVFGKKN